jgi:hypothetical protein
MQDFSTRCSQTEPATVEQRQLKELYRGSAGGRALRDRRGREYFRDLGRRGGRTTVQRLGTAHMNAIGERGRTERQRRLYGWPRNVRNLWGITERRIPYWPRHSTSRRQRPIMIYVEVQQ